jgi:peptidoglycan/xylan/chitin deacetylase (PgdA/CDA1 family)
MATIGASRRARASLIFLALLLVLLGGRQLRADETIIEGLNGAKKYAPLWPGGTFELGTDAGFPWARVTTDGQAGPTFVTNVRPYKPALDCRNKFLKVRVKIDDLDKLGGLEFRLSSDRFGSNYFAFSFPLYDDEPTNVVADGVWTTLTFPFGLAQKQGDPDRSAINSIGWYVADRGSDAPVTAYWGGMSLVDEPDQGVVSLTFDDGYKGQHAAARLMAEYGFRGTAYIIPDAVGQADHMALHDLVDLQERYGWEVAAHHQTSFTDLTPDQLESTLLGVQRFLEENGFRANLGHLAYPLGRQNTSYVRPLVRKHFLTARLAGAGPETLPPADPHLLRVMNVTNATTPEEIGAAARLARQDKRWLILMFHWMVDEASYSTQYSFENFQKVLDELKRAKVLVLPATEVWEHCGRSSQRSNSESRACVLGSPKPTLPAAAQLP